MLILSLTYFIPLTLLDLRRSYVTKWYIDKSRMFLFMVCCGARHYVLHEPCPPSRVKKYTDTSANEDNSFRNHLR